MTGFLTGATFGVAFVRPGDRYATLLREGFPNVIVLVTDLGDRRAANRLGREINAPLRELVPRSTFYASRCWFR